jgi:hypothetical protein
MTATSYAANETCRLARLIRRLGAVTLLAAARVAGAQWSGLSPIVAIGSDADDRARVAQLGGSSATDITMLRSMSRLSATFDSTTKWRFGFAIPEVRAVRNSGLPFSLNDGPLWAGRGWSRSITPAVIARTGWATLILAPSFVSSDNERFQVIPYPQVGRSPRSVWANPFHPLPESIDLPLRFGDQRVHSASFGQSSLTVNARGVAVGIASENLWWGPGIRNAITLSNNAPGFPHLFLQTRQPLHTRAGTFDAQWVVGQLSDSHFFDSTSTGTRRTLSGLAATWTTPFDSTLTLGIARIVMSSTTPRHGFPFAAFDVLHSVGHLNTDTLAPVPSPARDQITSLFGRWLYPAAGFEAYAEWARFEEPLSLHDFLEFPGHSEGYTLGFQWARPVSHGRTFRLQSEASYLEPDPSLRLRPVAVTYTSRGVPQGFTEQGQMLGAAIGPGASSQWLAADVLDAQWRLGPYLGRIRWDNGTFEEPIVPLFKRPDVSLFAGLRGGVTWRGVDLLVDFTHAARFNYLFQTYIVPGTNRTQGVDLINNTLSVTVSTARIAR